MTSLSTTGLNRFFRAKSASEVGKVDVTTAKRFFADLIKMKDPLDGVYQVDRMDKALFKQLISAGGVEGTLSLLHWVGQEALSGGSCHRIQQRVLEMCWRTPGISEELVELLASGKVLESANLMALAWWMERLVSAEGPSGSDARSDEAVEMVVGHLRLSSFKGAKAKADAIWVAIHPPGTQAEGDEDWNLVGEDVQKKNQKGESHALPVSLDATKFSFPGGRHDNDKEDFRDIQIVPTIEEILCTDPPFLPMPADVQWSTLDRHFRLLREDLVGTVRDSMKLLPGGNRDKQGTRQGKQLFVLDRASRGEIHLSDKNRGSSLNFHFDFPHWHPACKIKGSRKVRYDYFDSGPGRNLLRRDCLVVLLDRCQNPLLVASVVNRDPDMLIGGAIVSQEQENKGGKGKERLVGLRKRPSIGLGFFSPEDFATALQLSQYEGFGSLVPLNLGAFSYAPILQRLRDLVEVPMGEILLGDHDTETAAAPHGLHSPALLALVAALSPSSTDEEFRTPIAVKDLPKLPGGYGTLADATISLDISQRRALASALSRRVSLIQGPPGTGKTFLGIAVIKALLALTNEKILVVCYTNHALDSFLEGLLGQGISDIRRLGKGSKSDAIKPLLTAASGRRGSFTRQQSAHFGSIKRAMEQLTDTITAKQNLVGAKLTVGEVLRWLNLHGETGAWMQLSPPKQESGGMKLIGRGGQAVSSTTAATEWRAGRPKPSYGVLADVNDNSDSGMDLWALDGLARKKLWAEWEAAAREERARELADMLVRFDELTKDLKELRTTGDADTLQERIVACTTTGAAMQRQILDVAKCGIVLVEEAAEILESHIISCCSSNTKLLCMIGDHLQLRPKVEQWSLSRESGQGYDLNISLFERLVEEGFPHDMLELQHRMPPEVSTLVRSMTYPALRDGPGTSGRPAVRGMRGRVAFVTHHEVEETSQSVSQLQDQSGSKVNLHEVKVTVCIVQYLLRQGYDAEQLVVLTPYLAQLQELRSRMPAVVSAMDIGDLVRGGGSNGDIPGSSSTSKGIRVATIDNYQGEESDIVIFSLVRSNESGSMGFLRDANRANVAISRARHGMIVLGNADFLTSPSITSRQGRLLWERMVEEFRKGGAMRPNGFPAICTRHGTEADLATPADFELLAPDGGCQLRCDATLPCGHPCPRRCHPDDHAGAICHVLVKRRCPQGGHTLEVPCHERDSARVRCRQCDHEKQEAERLKREAERRATQEKEVNDRLIRARLEAAEQRRALQHAKALIYAEEQLAKEEAEAEQMRLESEALRVEADTMREERLTRIAADAARKSAAASSTAQLCETALMVQPDQDQKPAVLLSGGKTKKKMKGRASQNMQRAEVVAESSALDQLSDRVVRDALVSLSAAAREGDFSAVEGAIASVPGAHRQGLAQVLAPVLGSWVSTWFDILGQNIKQPPLPCRGTLAALQRMGSAEGSWMDARSVLLASAPSAACAAEKKEFAAPYAAALCNEFLNCGDDSSFLIAGLHDFDAALSESDAAFPWSGDALRSLAYAYALASDGQGAHAFAAAVTTLLALPRDQRLANLSWWESKAQIILAKTGEMAADELLPPSESGDSESDDKEASDLQTQWATLKREHALKSDATETLLSMSGMVPIKARFLSVASSAALDRIRGLDPAERSYNLRVEGNPGTGKTTISRLYAALLRDLGIFDKARRAALEAAAKKRREQAQADQREADVEAERKKKLGQHYIPPPPKPTPPPPSAQEQQARDFGLVEVTGAGLCDEGVGGLKSALENLRQAGGGVLFVDEAYHLMEGGQGKQVLNFLLPEMETRRAELVVIFAGYAKDLDKLFEHNEGLPSRFPTRLHFPDYSDELLLSIFLGLIASKKGARNEPFHLGAGCERWAEVAIRRLGRMRGSRGFGNARAVRSLFDLVLQRQTARLSKLGIGSSADLFSLEREDLLGPPAARLTDSRAWKELQSMVGLQTVKDSISSLAELVITNEVLELEGKNLRPVALNRLFLGNPGTGKTTCAKIYAQLLLDLGLLSKGEAVLKTASDFVGTFVGESEKITRGIIQASKGCVLVIDEAYGLFGGSGASGSHYWMMDPYRAAVIDTIVEQVQNVPGEDLAVVLLGYRKEMETMMRHANPGLARRFNLENAFVFQDYGDAELLSIVKGKLTAEQLTAGPDAMAAALQVLKRKRDTSDHFGNGGAVVNLLSEAKLRKESRRKDGSAAARLDPEILPLDFDPDFERPVGGSANAENELFGDLVGVDAVVAELRSLRRNFIFAASRGDDPLASISLNFRFVGAPGTGKTTVARRLGRMLKDLGALSSDEVVEVNGNDLIAGWVGHTGPKTEEVFKRARGKVLFIDEAYTLAAGHNSFASEVIDTMVQLLTSEEFMKKICVVLAGYPADIDHLMAGNAGLASRFPRVLAFRDLDARDTNEVFRLATGKLKMELGPSAEEALPTLAEDLARHPAFANGRTIHDWASRCYSEAANRVTGEGSSSLSLGTESIADDRLTADDLRQGLKAQLASMATSANPAPPLAASSEVTEAMACGQDQKPPPVPAPQIVCDERKEWDREDPHADENGGESQTAQEGGRALSDTDYEKIRCAAEATNISPDQPVNQLLSNSQFLQALGDQGMDILARFGVEKKDIQDQIAREDQIKSDEEQRFLELDRAAQAAREAADLAEARRLAEEKAALERERKREKELEAARQRTLHKIGNCVMGYRWLRRSGGWQCAGGSHFCSDAELAAALD